MMLNEAPHRLPTWKRSGRLVASTCIIGFFYGRFFLMTCGIILWIRPPLTSREQMVGYVGNQTNRNKQNRMPTLRSAGSHARKRGKLGKKKQKKFQPKK